MQDIWYYLKKKTKTKQDQNKQTNKKTVTSPSCVYKSVFFLWFDMKQ